MGLARRLVAVEPRGKGRKAPDKIQGLFVPLRHDVLKSLGYRALGHPARNLLVDIAMQYIPGRSRNNGALVACEKYLKPLGWRSKAVIGTALRELLECGLLIKTRQGGINRTSLYALAFHNLDRDDRHDPGMAISFSRLRSRYKTYCANPSPSDGVGASQTGPSRGERDGAITPSNGLVRH